MHPKTLQHLDRRIGIIICYILTIHRLFLELFKKNNFKGKRYSKILFIKLIEQGSIILAYPAVKKAISLVGKENVYFLIFKENRDILDILDILRPSNIIELNSKNLINFVISFFMALSRIRRENIDVCIDMEFFSRISSILSYLSKAKIRVGLHRFNLEGLYRGDLFTHKIIYNPYLHTKLFFLSLVNALDYPPNKDSPLAIEIPSYDGTIPKFHPSKEELEIFEDKLKKIKCFLNKPVIILNPNSGDIIPIRRWPQENFIKLGILIKKNLPSCSIIITGTGDEKRNSDYLASQIIGSFSLAGKTTLRELLILYYLSDILITNDSGPAHFASLTPIKSIILFGPETPLLYGQNQKEKIELYSPLICSPCLSVYNQRFSVCRFNKCLMRITPQEVFEKVKELLG